MADRLKASYTIKSINHALDVLERFQGGTDEFGIPDLSKSSELSMNYLSRLLATLEKHDFIEINETTQTYRLGVRNLEIAHALMMKKGLLQKAKPVLAALTKECEESSCLAIMRDYQICFADIVESSHPIRVAYEVGSLLPAHSTAAGKVHLAEKDLNAYLSLNQLHSRTPNTITSADELRKQLQLIAEKGYALDNEETDNGVKGIGAPIKNHSGSVIGAVSIYGPVTRFTDERMRDKLIPLVMMAAEKFLKN